MNFDHKKIEKKWQAFWKNHKVFKSSDDFTKPKYYVLDMFPYPSGSGLHVGHVEGYTATDILGRHKKQRGFNVLHPMGWDAFGLPAEQYAVRTGTHPEVTTKKNIDNFRRQLQSLGFAYDWDREINTSDPSYYKWTQWIFTLLYEKGLAYEAEVSVNYCSHLGTVVANEEVDNGKTKEGGYPVERKALRQWMLKITAYADRLIEDLDLIDWPDHLKKLQINWIGRSEGATIRFSTEKKSIECFTTRPDTIFGVSYLVLAPEHPLALELTTPDQSRAVDAYLVKTRAKSDLERTDLAREKTGVFTGSYAVNPASGKKIPVWIADYVLASYGTGAVMAVPAHDERDFEFATIYQLPIIPILDPLDQDNEIRGKIHSGKMAWEGDGTMHSSSAGQFSIDGMNSEKAKTAVIGWLEASGEGEKTVSYKLRDWLFSRQRYWGEPFPLLHLENGEKRVLGLDELPLMPPMLEDFKPAGDGRSPLAKVVEWTDIVDAKTGKKAHRETNTMPQWAGSCWYYLRFLDPKNDHKAWDPEKEKYWMPVDLYVGGVEHAVLHLLYARFWHKVLFDLGLVSTKEPFQTMRNQGIITSRSFQRPGGGYVEPENTVEKNGEYFEKGTGQALFSQVEKMSKSKLNGVTPDEIIEEFGADALRLYEMFLGPLEKEKIWNTHAVSGVRRFLNRFHDMAVSEKVVDHETPEGMKLAYRLVASVAQDIDSLSFNTAIAKMMEFVNAFSRLDAYPRRALLLATQALSPFAPHLAEEVWEILGGPGLLAEAHYPKIDPKLYEEEMVTYVIQVNGKFRARMDLSRDTGKEALAALAYETPTVKKAMEGKPPSNLIFVPGRLLNIVI